MPFEILSAAPSAADFTPLQEHQEQTPGTFFGAKPVLHLHVANAQLLISQADLTAQTAFPDLRAPATTSTATNGTVNGTDPSSEHTQLTIPGIDVWVTSHHLLIFSPAASTGISLPYPSITLHAIQTLPTTTSNPPQEQQQQPQGLYTQILLNGPDTSNTPDDDLQTLELTIVPPPAAAAAPTAADLFAAVSACADLNPDPQEIDSEDEGAAADDLLQAGGGALPGGWITAENVHEHVDAEGNFVGFGGGAALGAGAGTVRPREEAEGEAEGDEEEGGDGAGGEETKWRRTE